MLFYLLVIFVALHLVWYRCAEYFTLYLSLAASIVQAPRGLMDKAVVLTFLSLERCPLGSAPMTNCPGSGPGRTVAFISKNRSVISTS